MLDECAVRAVRKIRRPKIHDGRLLITYSSNDVRVPPQSPVLKNGKLRIKLMTCTVNNNLYYFTLLQLIYLLMSVEFPLGLLCLRMVN